MVSFSVLIMTHISVIKNYLQHFLKLWNYRHGYYDDVDGKVFQ